MLILKQMNMFGVTPLRNKNKNRQLVGVETNTKIKITVGENNVFAIMKTRTSGGNGIKSEIDSIQIKSDTEVSVSSVKYYFTGTGDYFTYDKITEEMKEHYKIIINDYVVFVKNKKTANEIAEKFK